MIFGSFATVQWPIERGYLTMFVPAAAVTNDQHIRLWSVYVTTGPTG